MKTIHTGLLITVLLLAGCSSKPAPPPEPGCSGCEVIRHVRVVDADGAREDRRVVLSAGMILSESPDDGPVSGAASELDGSGRTLVPGLWDAHVHLMASAGVNTLSSPYLAEHLKALLASGVTSVFDLGSPQSTLFSLRDRVERGELLSPHLRMVGPFFSVPRGHPCTVDYSADTCALVTTPESAEPLVAALAEKHPDFLKLVFEAGGAPFDTLPRLSLAQATAVRDAAARHGLRLVAHVATAQDFADALQADVAAIAHVPEREVLSEEFISLAAQRKVAVITTLSVHDALPRLVDTPAFLDPLAQADSVPLPVLEELRSPEFARWMSEGGGSKLVEPYRAFLATQAENLRRLHRAGVPLLAGTDSGNPGVFHGPGLQRELELLVQAGLTPVEALTTATLLPARLFGLEERSGRVAAGQRADLVLVEGDPSVDIRALRDVREIWLDGVRLDRSTLGVSTSPRTLVLRSRTVEAGSFCLLDEECAGGFACDRSRLCARTCRVADASTCPAGAACFADSATSPRGFCSESDGCNPLGRDCPFQDAYRTTCVPWESDTSYCFPPGTAPVGATCSWYSRNSLCAEGLACNAGHCAALCDPTGSALPACAAGTSCADQQAVWGQPVGLCQ